MLPNGSHDQFDFANELMWMKVILNGNTFNNSHDLGDLNVWLLNFLLIILNIYFKYIDTSSLIIQSIAMQNV